MTHLTDLQCSMYVDQALDVEAQQTVEAHTASCASCRERLALHQTDIALMRNLLAQGESEAVVPPMKMPTFKRPIGLRELALANLATGGMFWLIQFAWKTLFGELLMDGFAWITSLVIPDIYDLTVDSIFYITLEGAAMIETYATYIAMGVLALGMLAMLVVIRHSRATVSLMTLILAAGILAPGDAAAIEHQKGDLIIAAGETVADTLIFTGESLVVDGTIEGDLIAFSRRVVVNGEIQGNLVTFAESISISGRVGGTTISAGESVDINEAIMGSDLWSAGERVTLTRSTRVEGNAMLAGERVTVDGEVTRDLVTAAETAELSGTVGEDMMAYVDAVKLGSSANITGDLKVHAHSEAALQQSASAQVGGDISFHLREHGESSENRYATLKFYVLQLLRLAGALLAGYAVLMLFPALRDVTLQGGVAGLTTAGIGLATLVVVPLMMAVLAITVIGLPLSVIGVFSWMLALYFAKILAGWVIGNLILGSADEDNESVALPLLVGMGVVIVAINLPFIGGVVSLLLSLLGLGMLVQWVFRHYQRADQASL